MIMDMDLLWNPPMAEAWARFHRQHHGALQQSWAYGEALRSMGVEVIRVAALERGQWMACAQFIARRILGYVSLVSCARGPVFEPHTDGDWRWAFIDQIRRELPVRPLRVPLFSPNQAQADFDRSQVRGLHRVMTGYSTVMVDLGQPIETLRADLESKWRNRLTRAETNSDLKVFIQPSRAQLQTLLDQEVLQRRAKGFFGLPIDFVSAYVAAHEKPAQAFRLAWVEQKRETIAAMLFLFHGGVATYHLGWANESGRKTNAHNLLLWRAMQELPTCGVQYLDLGGVNTHDLAGISRFKLGVGGQVLTLPGTFFLICPSPSSCACLYFV